MQPFPFLLSICKSVCAKVRFDTIVFSCPILLSPKKFIAQHDLETQNKTFKAIDFKMKMI